MNVSCQKYKVGEYYIDLGIYSCSSCLQNKYIKMENKLKLLSGRYFCCGAIGYSFQLEKHDFKCINEDYTSANNK